MDIDGIDIETPCYIVDETALERNLKILDSVQQRTECKIIMALKGFAMFSLFPLIRQYLSGVAASSLHEARLGFEEFSKEVHICSPAYIESEFDELLSYSSHIVFNSFSQWNRFRERIQQNKKNIQCGIRINPEHSEVKAAIYDPCARYSRLGVTVGRFRKNSLEGITGLHFHTLCELNADALNRTLEAVFKKFDPHLKTIKWMNFGGGHHITRSDYDVDLSAIDPMVLGQVQYQNQIVGLPFSVFTQVLCYNRQRISLPPATLDKLMEDVETGHRLGQQASFSELAWTMSALGGSFFNDANHVEIEEGELASWLEWLVEVNKQPNFIISVDMEQLEEAFIAGELDYLVCPSERIPALHEAMSQDVLGVVPLPAQNGSAANAYFTTDIIIFSPAADSGSVARGVNLADFLTRPAQQTTLALETLSQIPVNLEVDIDSRLAPFEATLLAQPRVAAPLDFLDLELLSLELAEPIVDRVLAGEVNPADAASELTNDVNDLWRDKE